MVVVMIHLRIIAIILSIVVCRLASGQYLKSDAPQIINNSNYSARENRQIISLIMIRYGLNFIP